MIRAPGRTLQAQLLYLWVEIPDFSTSALAAPAHAAAALDPQIRAALPAYQALRARMERAA
jgi:hypothetical protein